MTRTPSDMRNRHEFSFEDIQVLHDSSKSLLGYFIHRWFHEYLIVVNEALRQLHEDGLITSLTKPTARGRRAFFDFRALDLDKLAHVVGIYLYVYLSHKSANYRLIHRFDGKQVLFLRGYDFEGAVSSGSGTALGSYSLDTMQFGRTLRGLLERDFSLFKVTSPMDLYWETLDAQHYFDGDYDGMQRLIGQRPASVYLNARTWQEGVTYLLDRMDHYVVYVSSITESVLWELEQLDTDARRERVTVVFDEEAIAGKEGRAEFPGALAARFGLNVAWHKEEPPPARAVSDLQKQLSARFLVTTRDQFEAQIDRHRERIAASASPLAPGARETWIDFRFHPAVEPDRLAELHDLAEELEAMVSAATRDGIECLPLFLAVVQLRIYTTLLLGQHDEAGGALAAYAGIMRGARDYYEQPEDRIGALAAENRDRILTALQAHHDMSRHAGLTLAALGKSHEFDSIFAAATTAFSATLEATRAAVVRFSARGGGQVRQ
jgi:hypothetical protein